MIMITIMMKLTNTLKGQGHAMSTYFFRNDNFAVFLIGHITVIFHYYSQNESVSLETDSCTS